VQRDHTLTDIDGWFINDFASNSSIATMINLEPDVIVHCAGTSLVGPSMTDPGEYYHNNIAKTIQWLNTIKNMNKQPVVMFSSSASVYGEPKQLPIPESADIQPISPYGATKAMTERMLEDYSRAYGLSSVVFRYFNAAGAMPGTHDLGQEPGATHIVARVLEASIANRAFTINGGDFDTADGTCVRDYVHVWDIAQAHVRAAHYAKRGGSHLYRVFNLGTNAGISNKQIVDYVVEHYGLPHVNFGERRAGDPAALIADATQARNELGWTPVNSSLSSIVDSAYQWYTKS
jgi:UDP-glucose 4-epimerase